MGMSIYYRARRRHPMTIAERQEVRETVDRYAVGDRIVERERTGDGPNWESFCIYDPAVSTEPRVLLEGATKLQDNAEEACWIGLQHWCKALTDIRSAMPDAAWSVHMDDHEITWDEQLLSYDPSA